MSIKLVPGKLYKLKRQLTIVGGHPSKEPWENTTFEKDSVYLCTSFKTYRKYRHASIQFLVGLVEVAISVNSETLGTWFEAVK